MPTWARGWRHYREKHDESFARYFLSADANTWRVQTPGGTITEFGRALFAAELSGDDEATERDQLQPGAPVFRWLPARSFDSHGGLVVYRWVPDASGKGRRVLSDIWDTPRVGETPQLREFAHHVHLEWDANVAWSPPRYARIDRARLASRLKRVIVAAMPWEDSSRRDVLRVYHLEYLNQRLPAYDPSVQAPLLRRSFLHSVQLEGRCGIQEGPAEEPPTNFVCPRLPAVSFDYEPGPIHGVISLISELQPPVSSSQPLLETLSASTLLDVNGDGLPDVVQSWPTEFPLSAYIAAGFKDRALRGFINLGREIWQSRLELKSVCMDPGRRDVTGTVSFFSPVEERSTFLSSRNGSAVLARWADAQALWSQTGFGPIRTERVQAHADFCDEAARDPNQEAWAWRASSRAPWLVPPALLGSNNARGKWFTDVDGDGYPDLLERVQGDPAVGLELGQPIFTRQYGMSDKRSPQGQAVLMPFDARFQASQRPNSLVPAEGHDPSRRYVFVDVNGDGINDLVSFVRGSTNEFGSVGITVRPGDGRGRFECKEDIDNTPISFPFYRHCEKRADPAFPWLTDSYVLKLLDTPASDVDAGDDPLASHEWRLRDGGEWYMHDVTGDGLADFIVLSVSDGRLIARLWVNEDGKNFRCVNPSTRCLMAVFADAAQGTLVQGEPHRVVFADMDGSGRDGLVLLTKRGVYFATAIGGITAKAPRPGLLTRIDNGHGASTLIEYTTTASLAREAARKGSSWETFAPVPLTVVRRVETRASAGSGSAPNTALPEPFSISRTVEFDYRDPAWDPWSRRVAGFRKARVTHGVGEASTETTRWFGPCQQPRAAAPCAATPEGNADEGRSGRILRVDRVNFATVTPSWLSSKLYFYQTNQISRGPDGGSSYTYSNKAELYRYEPGVPVQAGTSGPTTGDRIENPPRQNGVVVVTSLQEIDQRGNLVRADALGRGPSQDKPIRTVKRFDCDAEWRCLVQETSTSWIVSSPSEPQYERKFRFSYEDGLLKSVSGYLDRAPTLFRLHEDSSASVAPAPSGVSTPGWVVLTRYGRDELGNIISSERPGQAGACTHLEFERVYRRYPASAKAYTAANCQGSFQSMSLRYDTAFQTAIERDALNGDRWSAALDAFGRVTEVREPTGSGAFGVLGTSSTTDYHDSAPSWKRTRYVVAAGAPHERWTFFNALTEPVLQYERGYTALGDPQAWRGLSWIERQNSSGRITRTVGPWAQATDPVKSISSLTVVSPGSAALATSFVYDGFGRLVQTLRFTEPIQRFVYHPQSTEVFDAVQLASSPENPSFGTIYKQDGHGRLDEVVRRVEQDEIRTHFDRLPTGEPMRYTYSHAANGARIVHDLDIDTLGRLIQTFEPNSTAADTTGRRGRQFAWDDAGHLVGDADARGCGRNYFYDAVGRIVGEDYSPCTREHPAYSALGPQGAGLEVSYRYDTYEPGDSVPSNFQDDARHARGRLTSMRDRGAWTRFSYDGGGHIRRVLRNLAAPSSPGAPTSYTALDFVQLHDYDVAGRLIRQTSGARSEVTGQDSFVAFAYSPRGALSAVDSSEGRLLGAVTYRDDGLPSSMVYGDLAGTRAAYTYDRYGRLNGYRYDRAAPLLWTTPFAGYSLPTAETAITQLADVSTVQDALGNPKQVVDAFAGAWPAQHAPLTADYDYDSLYRVRRLLHPSSVAWSPPFEHEHRTGDRSPAPPTVTALRPLSIKLGYDWTGNTTSVLDDAGLVYDRSLDAIVNGGAAGEAPHQLRAAAGIKARYDAAGQLVELTAERPGRCFAQMCAQRYVYSWDEVGRLMRARRWDYSGNNLPAGTAAWPNVGSGSVRDLQFLYSNGERVIRQVTDETGANRYDLAVFDTLTLAGVQANAAGTGYRTPPSSAHVRHAGFAHVFLAPGLPLSDATSSRTFLDLKDSLGSSTITIDRATSEVVERTSYLPYGNVENRFRPERWAGAPESAATPRYTGKSIDAEVGVINFGARYLQAHLGRWMSPDPLVVANIIQDFNPYAFIEGRLAAAVDPDGLQATVVRPDYIVFDGDPLTGHVPRDAITLPTEKIAGTPPFEPAVSDPVAKARAMGRGHIEAGDLSSFMRGIGNVGLGVLNFLAKAGPADGPPLDPNPPSQLFTSIAPLQGHERAAWYGEEFGRALAFQVVSGMVGRAVTGAGTAENVAAIATPYGPAIQSGKAAALAARAEVEGGATVYRIGTMGKSFAADAQFWSLESPLSPGYAGRYGLPADNVGDFITGATMKPGTSFITRPAPAIGSNVGGGIEVVVPPGGVQLKWFTMPNF